MLYEHHFLRAELALQKSICDYNGVGRRALRAIHKKINYIFFKVTENQLNGWSKFEGKIPNHNQRYGCLVNEESGQFQLVIRWSNKNILLTIVETYKLDR